MGTSAPEVHAASCDAKYARSAATASGGTHAEKSASGIAARLGGVSITLGRIALAVTPSFFSSFARVWTSAWSPSFAAAYAAAPGVQSTAPREQTQRSRPLAVGFT